MTLTIERNTKKLSSAAAKLKNKEVRYFEVRTGENKGFYFVESNENKHEARALFGSEGFCLGIISEYNVGFYQRHKAKGKRIWTHTRFTTHEFNRERFEEYISQLESLGFTVIKD
ncbi:hypothetical protein [Bacillus bombysepticus]|uniref:hypothetical protein n=1 Tax=Bacillus bombysepticus TaxID=658666 RepID=UPI0030161E01